jgi:hypothetical protein
MRRSGTLVEESTKPSTSLEVYHAPEVQARQSFGAQADIFLSGCISIELLTFVSAPAQKAVAGGSFRLATFLCCSRQDILGSGSVEMCFLSLSDRVN